MALTGEIASAGTIKMASNHCAKGARAGRASSATKAKTCKTADQVPEQAKTPLDVLLENMHYYVSKAKRLDAMLRGEVPLDEWTYVEDDDDESQPAKDEDIRELNSFDDGTREVIRLRMLASKAARIAAPYVHSRIKPVDANSLHDDFVPLAERLAEYARSDLEASGDKDDKKDGLSTSRRP
jgi:hypothetical protein